MIAALIAVLFLGSSSYFLVDISEASRDRANDVIADVDRREQVDEIFDQLADSAKSQQDKAKDALDRLADLAEQHSVGETETKAAVADYWVGMISVHNEIIEARSEIKKHVSREEWEEIFNAPPDAAD